MPGPAGAGGAHRVATTRRTDRGTPRLLLTPPLSVHHGDGLAAARRHRVSVRPATAGQAGWSALWRSAWAATLARLPQDACCTSGDGPRGSRNSQPHSWPGQACTVRGPGRSAPGRRPTRAPTAAARAHRRRPSAVVAPATRCSWARAGRSSREKRRDRARVRRGPAGRRAAGCPQGRAPRQDLVRRRRGRTPLGDAGRATDAASSRPSLLREDGEVVVGPQEVALDRLTPAGEGVDEVQRGVSTHRSGQHETAVLAPSADHRTTLDVSFESDCAANH